MNKKKKLQIVILCAASIIILVPLLSPFFPPGMVDTYDGYLHQFRMAAFHASLKEGIIPPRWSTQLAYGWGSPVLNFNWSLPYWLAEPLLFLNWTTTEAQKAVVMLSVLFLFFSMFLFLYVWLGIWSAITGATLSVWALFYIYMLYTSGAVGIQVGLIFWPLLFLSVIMATRKQTVYAFLLGSISVALTMLSHQIMFLIIQPLFWSFTLFIHFTHKKQNVLRLMILSSIFGLGLSAYFWLPAIVEKEFINIASTESNYQTNFLEPLVLLLQPKLFELAGDFWWKRLYGVKLYGVGWPLLFVSFLSLINVIPLLTKKALGKRRFIAGATSIFFIFFLIALFFITPASQRAWEVIPLLSSFIYPLRFQALALFSGSILAALFIHTVRHKAVFSIAIICLTIILNYHAIPQNLKRLNIPDEHYYSGDSTSDVAGEFLPRWTATNPWTRYPAARIVQGTGTIQKPEKKSASVSFIAAGATEIDVVINQLYFPGWRVEANGKALPTTITSSGEIGVRLPVGTHVINAGFRNTPIRTVGNIVTTLTGIFMLFLLTF
jgi:hypothetical protein